MPPAWLLEQCMQAGTQRRNEENIMTSLHRPDHVTNGRNHRISGPRIGTSNDWLKRMYDDHNAAPTHLHEHLLLPSNTSTRTCSRTAVHTRESVPFLEVPAMDHDLLENNDD